MLDIISCRVMISLENLLWLYCSAWQQNAISFGQSSSGRLLFIQNDTFSDTVLLHIVTQ